jgi:hypothetical protein
MAPTRCQGNLAGQSRGRGFRHAQVVTGTGFEARGLPLLASIGAVVVEAILPFPDGSSFSGYLATTPNDGDVLSFGFAVSTVTELAYHSGEVA